MNPQLPLFPQSASTMSPQVDALFITWSVISIFFTVLIAVLILYFMARYRRRSADEVGQEEKPALLLEITWSVIPLCIVLTMFVWGTRVFFRLYRPTSLLGRFTSAEEVANLAVYLCGAGASATTGAALRADGGVVNQIM